MFFTVAAQALGVALFCRQILETNDFGDISSSFHMLGARAMAGFTAMPILKGRFEMGSPFKVALVQLFVAGLTSISADVLGFRRIR